MHSSIYEGRVRHRRFAPVAHAFTYRLFMMYLDLDELPRLFDRHPLWSPDRSNLAQFRRRDHLGDPDHALDDSVRDYVQQHGGQRPAGPIRLLTHMRYFGYRFNPVSFFYCFDAADQQIETIIAEITNTPWGERYPYVLSESLNSGSADKKRYHLAKDFHISPFMGMDQHYAWRFTTPGSHLAVHMENYEHDARLFAATMTLKRREITGRALTGALLRYPLITARMTAAIYWQAARIYLKKCPFYPHPKWLQAETTR